MIVLSMVLVLLGAVTLVLGFFIEDQPAFIYTTIGSASAAALLLVVAIARQRSGDRQPALAMAGGEGDERRWATQPWAAASSGVAGTLERREEDPEFFRPGSSSGARSATPHPGGVTTGDPDAPLYGLLEADDQAPPDEVEGRVSGQWWTSEPDPTDAPPARSVLDLGLDSGWPANSEGAVGVDQGAAGVGQGAAGVGQGAAGVGQGAVGVGQGAVGVGQGAVGVGQGAAGVGQGAASEDYAAEEADTWGNQTEARFWQDSWHDQEPDAWALDSQEPALDSQEPALDDPDPDPQDAPAAAGGAAGEIPSADRETERLLEVLRPIRGVGPSKQSELLAYFKTLRRLRNASVERIAEVPGVSLTLAQRIHSELHR